MSGSERYLILIYDIISGILANAWIIEYDNLMIKNDNAPILPVKAADLVIPPKDRKTLRALKRNECRWPYGDPRQKDFYFCGKPRIGSSPYCEFHKRRAFQPTRQRDYRPYRPGMAA